MNFINFHVESTLEKNTDHSLDEQPEILSQLFSFKSFGVEFKIFGEGADTIICFHGFGRKADDFRVFIPLLQKNQRMIALNLFAHGSSQFPEERIDKYPLLPEEWLEILEAFLKVHRVEKFHLLAYSMGGRIAMKTYELMPERITSMILIAPDGFKRNLLYRFASGTAIGKSIYRSIIDNPGWLFGLAKALNKTGLLSDKLHRFVHVHLDTKFKRQQVHDAWLIYRLFFSDLRELANAYKKHQFIPVLIFGKYDSVIRPRLAENFNLKTDSNFPVHILPAGHRLMTGATADYMQEAGLWPG